MSARVASRLAVAPMHEEPTRKSEQVTEALLGEPLDVLETRQAAGSSWLRVAGGDRYAGWLPASNVSAVAPTWPGRDAVRIGAREALVHDGASGRPLRRVVFGCVLARRSSAGTAEIGVSLPEGVAGVVSPAALRPFHESGRGTRLEAVAESVLGIPYRWGGRSVQGVDCSGLVQLVAGELGLALPRDADLQEAHAEGEGASVTRGALEAGDLIFFGRGGETTHVAIALGPDSFLHARAFVRVGEWARGEDADLGSLVVSAYRVPALCAAA